MIFEAELIQIKIIMKKTLRGLLTLFMVLAVQILFAQERTITGTVIDEEGLPLPGVNVIEKGTSNGVQTDFDGNYSIKVEEGDVIVFSYVGFSAQEREITASTSSLDVTLQVSADALDEVLVVAYGAQREKAIVGSVASLDSEVIQKQQLTSVTQAIQGNVPGVNILTSGGQPGENPTIRIRGVSSINASAEPLIVVDGAPYNGNINSISPDQIESMNVLKDASSTALYGSRGANGVIVITTKRGGYNTAPSINITATGGLSSPAVDLHETIGTNQYMRYSWEAERNALQYIDGVAPNEAGALAAQSIIPNLAYNPYNVDQPVDANGNIVDGASLLWETDWQKEMLRETSLRQEYGMSISGGGESSRYFLSANYLDQEGSVKESDFERITTRLNLESQLTDWLQVGLNSSLTVSEQNYPEQSGNSYQSSIQWIYSVSSVYPLYRRDANGDLVFDNGAPIYDYGSTSGQALNGTRPMLANENAVGSLYNYDNLNKRTSATANAFAKIDFTDYLSFRTNLSYENYLYDSNVYAAYNVGYAANVGGRVTQNRDITTTLNFINSLNFNKDFGKHNVQADAIFESYKYKGDYLSAQGTGFLPGVKVLNGSTTPESVGGYVNEERLVSYLGRASYSYDDRYFIEGSFRRDGSSRFSTDTRWGNFFSVGGSWVISDENFLAGNSTLNFLKLKASYGELGNNRGIGYFPYLQLFETGWNQLDATGVLLGGVTDPLLSWEKTASFNVGVDFGLFNDRLTGLVEYYEKESVDLIYDQPLPISTGNSSITTNIGAVKNYGLEVTLNGKIINKDNFSWSAGLNFSFDNNEITELTQDSFINGTKRWEEGKSLYEFYMQDWAGVDPADGYGMWYMDVLDDNGNPTGERTTTKDYSEASRYYNGSSLPDIIGGFNTDLTWGNFDFNMLFNFSFGSQVYDGSYASLMRGFSTPGYQSHEDIAARWQEPGDVTNVPLLLNAQNDFNSRSTRFLFDNDYVRLRAVTLGYTLPGSVVEELNMNSLRVYLRGDNLFTYHSHFGIDPEQSVAGTTNNRSYILKTVSVGLNLQF